MHALKNYYEMRDRKLLASRVFGPLPHCFGYAPPPPQSSDSHALKRTRLVSQVFVCMRVQVACPLVRVMCFLHKRLRPQPQLMRLIGMAPPLACQDSDSRLAPDPQVTSVSHRPEECRPSRHRAVRAGGRRQRA